MAGFGDLVVSLKADTTNFKKGMADAKGGLSSFASGIKSLVNPITAGIAAITGAAVATGVAVYGLTERIGGLAKVADQATQTGLSGAFIQRLGFAADQSGVNVETLIGGIKKLTIAIGEGDDTKFKSIGLTLADLQKMNPEQQFLAVAQAISKLPTAAERAAAAVKIFGKSGVDMTGLFAGGMEDLTALMEEAERLGIGVSAEGLAKAAAADDAIQKMKASFSALIDQVAVGVAPVFESIANYITEWIPPVTKFFESFNALENKMQWVKDIIEASMVLAFENIKVKWQEMLKGMIAMAVEAGKGIAEGLSGVAMAKRVFGGGQGQQQESGLAAAEKRFAEVMQRLNEAPALAAEKAKVEEKPKPKQGRGDQGKFNSLIDEMAGPAADMLAKGWAMASSKIDTAKAFGSSVVDWVQQAGQTTQQQESTPTRLAGALAKGSTEAYSAIVSAMTARQDPNVKATEKQTKEIVKALKTQPQNIWNMVEAFVT